jgi:hypothetical protein
VPEYRLWYALSISSGVTSLHGRVIGIIQGRESRFGEFTEGLWNGDVIELFIGQPESEQYLEFNLAPSGAWWAAAFSRYRERSTDILAALPMTIQSNCAAGYWEFFASFDLAATAVNCDSCTINLCAIFGSPNRRFFSAHAPVTAGVAAVKPDFHRAELRQTPLRLPTFVGKSTP